MKNSSDIIGNRSRDLLVCSECQNQLHHRVPRFFVLIILTCVNCGVTGIIYNKVVITKPFPFQKAESVYVRLFKGYGVGDRVSVAVRASENFSFA
jgi:hydrogenase maturation factor HypF (carbamoyltransferase family)